MAIYWIIYLIPLIAFLLPVRLTPEMQRISLMLFGVLLIIVIGLRHEVGGDWDRYLIVYDYLENKSFFEAIKFKDIGYEFIHWFSYKYFNGIYTTNFISATIFVTGLIYFCRLTPAVWLSLCISIPIMVIVVSMGYTRQALALSFFMLALISLTKQKFFNFYLLIFIGILFHKTLLIMIPVGILYKLNRHRMLLPLVSPNIVFSTISIVVVVVVVVIYVLTIWHEVEHMIFYYVEIKFHHSSGGLIRVMFGGLSALLFFIYRKEFEKIYHDVKIWNVLAYISIFLVPTAVFYSTLADRVALYLIPLQLIVISRVFVLIKSVYYRTLFGIASVTIYAGAMFIWFIFGKHSNLWLPYNNVLLIQ